MSNINTNPKIRNIIHTISVIFFFAVVLVGCGQIRLLTYPGEFVWLEDEYVKGTMQKMATHMANLQSLIEVPNISLDDNNRDSIHQEIVNEMELLEEFAISISPKSSGTSVSEYSEFPATNHLLIDQNIDDFISEIMKARTLADLAPPNYSGIGQLVGNCNACHRQR
ncbi:MAG: hypothetical protein ACI9XK_001677 [Granulosicoccus sp.]|jgi:hypothetical protein